MLIGKGVDVGAWVMVAVSVGTGEIVADGVRVDEKVGEGLSTLLVDGRVCTGKFCSLSPPPQAEKSRINNSSQSKMDEGYFFKRVTSKNNDNRLCEMC